MWDHGFLLILMVDNAWGMRLDTLQVWLLCPALWWQIKSSWSSILIHHELHHDISLSIIIHCYHHITHGKPQPSHQHHDHQAQGRLSSHGWHQKRNCHCVVYQRVLSLWPWFLCTSGSTNVGESKCPDRWLSVVWMPQIQGSAHHVWTTPYGFCGIPWRSKLDCYQQPHAQSCPWSGVKNLKSFNRETDREKTDG